MALWTLRIGLHDRAGKLPGVHDLGCVEGGPDALLHWLETQLGLVPEGLSEAQRIARYAARLETVDGPSWRDSLETDRWSTAEELLRRRDELRLHGWVPGAHGSEGDALPGLVRDLAAVEADGLEAPGPAERLEAVEAALDAGQRLPAHACYLAERAEDWPPRWQRVLARLETWPAEDPAAHAGEGTALDRLRDGLAAGEDVALTPDESLQWLRADSRAAAVEALAAALAEEPEACGDTAVLCEEPTTALLLDGALATRGLPTMGASAPTGAHPALQVLPLALAVSWEPVEPAAVLDLLSLPVGPIPGRAARRLARALEAQPGLGSAAWEEAVEELQKPDNDPDGRNAERIDAWLRGRRAPRGGTMPAELVRERAALVASWAAARAAALRGEAEAPETSGHEGAGDGEEASELAEVLAEAARRARALAELVGEHGAPVGEAQLQRMLEGVNGVGVPASAHPARAGGPTWLRSLAELRQPYDRLVWLGVGTATGPRRRWSRRDRAALQAAGVDVDDGAREIRTLREAERRGLLRVRGRLTVVGLPTDAEASPHPLWTRIHHGLEPGAQTGKSTRPVAVDQALACGEVAAVSPWSLPLATHAVRRPQPPRPWWHVPAELLRPPDKSSASELEARLGCPAKWLFSYGARLRSRPVPSLPADARLLGTFAHDVLARAFGAREHDEAPALPTPDEAVARVEEIFDERIGLDAAPLARPSMRGRRETLRRQLADATRVLVATLRDGGYRIAAMESRFDVPFDDPTVTRPRDEPRTLYGFIDGLAVDEGGHEAVIDFKYGGRTIHRDAVREGRATQLATYARGRSLVTGRSADDVTGAYLVLKDAVLFTPAERPLSGTTSEQRIAEAPDLATVWRHFERALIASSAWLDGREPVPARPLEDPERWPEGAELALPKPRKGQPYGICAFCDYAMLCGLTEAE